MTAQLVQERDFPKGHPKAYDYDPKSPEAIEWARKNIHPLGERDFPVDHPKAVDTPGNTNHIPWRAGIDPAHPELEEFTGSTPEVAAGRRAANLALAAKQVETPTTVEGFVNVGAIAEKSALDFLMAQGHDEQTAHAILAREGVDQVLAAKGTLAAKG